MKLGYDIVKDLIAEADSPIKTIVAIYPGRFQPMGKHHADVFKWLQGQFGTQHTYVATSDKVSLPKSPFTFEEKRSIILNHGIKNIVQVKNPYKPIEILDKYDPLTTAVVIVYGKKDAGRLRTTKKDGTPGYFQDFSKSKNNLSGYGTHGYFVISPHMSLKVKGFGEMSGTTLRAALSSADPSTFKEIFGWYDPDIFAMIKKKLTEQIEEFLTTVNIKDYLTESSVTDTGKGDVDDGPRYFYGNQSTYRKRSSDMAKRLGYEVINYLIKDSPVEVHNTKFPDGPPLTVSYFPTGVMGGGSAGTDYMKDMKGNPAYSVWQKYITKVAQQVGYKFLNFLGADTSIESSQGEELKPTTLREAISLPVEIGDTVLMGRFKNKKVVVKTVGWNEKGDLLINGRSAMRMRIVPQEPKPNTLGESLAIQLITEGGAAGHMNHPFDDRDITFGDMKQMIRLSLEGKLNIESGVQEKTDGQALSITFKDGKVGAARNKTTIKNPMDINAVKMKFAGRGEIEKAFSFAMQDLEKALLKIPRDKLNDVFQNGARFLNIEIIYPGTKNVIMYGPKAYIQFHGVDEYNLELATKVDSYPEYAPLLQKLIANVNAHIQSQFEIIPPRILTMNQLPDFEAKEQYFIDKVNLLQNQFQLKDSDELVMWHQKWWEGKIEQTIPYATEDIKLGLLKRWAYFDKSFRMNSKSIPDPEILQMAKDFDKQDFKGQNKHNVYNFEKIFLELGVEILHNISDYLSVVPSDATKDIKKRIAAKIKVIQQSKDLASLEKLKFELKRIEDLGGFEKLVPSEGIVFVYKGKTYKLTGLFAPVNQLLGIGGLSDK
tara:strand:+ start:161 stop:2641 length:2481 start_codon:yes stop_codon:yes gene_type:complete